LSSSKKKKNKIFFLFTPKSYSNFTDRRHKFVCFWFFLRRKKIRSNNIFLIGEKSKTNIKNEIKRNPSLSSQRFNKKTNTQIEGYETKKKKRKKGNRFIV